MFLKQSHQTFMFLKIASKYLSSFTERRICPDQCVGIIRVNNGTTSNPISNLANDDFYTRTNVKKFQRTNNPLIILILESPHTSEYKSIPKPAAGNKNGDTGKIIRDLFYDVCNIHNHIGNGNYDLVIVNAIQYQCSLGKTTKEYRDKVFKDSWIFFGRNNFKRRLLSLYKQGDIIINACTAGKKKPKIRELVKDAINKSIGVTTIEVEHPSNWRREYNKALKNNRQANYKWKS